MKTRVGLAVLAAGLLTGALAADDVLLTNGESFEGVIANLDGDHVRIRLEFGEIRLPAASVDRIESSSSALSEYLDRRRALLKEGAGASEWLELARWARIRELDHSYREALLEAAALDPALEGLDAPMRQIGYTFDAELDLWIPYEERMRRAGLVRQGDDWVRPEPRAQAAARDAEDRDVEKALSRTVEILALAQLEREARESRESRQTTRTIGVAPYGFPVAHFPGRFVASPAPPQPVAESPTRPGVTYEDLSRRQPGSLLPAGGANSGARVRQPGSLIPSKGTG